MTTIDTAKCPDGVECKDECKDDERGPMYCARTGAMSHPFNEQHEYEMHYCSDHRGGPEFCDREAKKHVERVKAARAKILGTVIDRGDAK